MTGETFRTRLVTRPGLLYMDERTAIRAMEQIIPGASLDLLGWGGRCAAAIFTMVACSSVYVWNVKRKYVGHNIGLAVPYRILNISVVLKEFPYP